jgi:general secretion pathway protein D
VEVEVEFVSIEKSSSLNYGLNLPNSVPIVNFGTALNSKPTIPAGFTSFLTFGGGATFLGMGVANAAAFATLTRSSAEVVLTSQIVSLDGQAATLHVGDRYPIITAGYYGATNGAGQVYSPPPVVNFEDLGVVLKVTPAVHDLGEVTLDVDADFKALGTTSSNGIPVIASRKLQGKLRLGSGEWAVIAGLVSEVDSETRNGIAGLSDLPWLGRFFSQNSHDKQSTEILIVLKPHLVTPSPWDFVSRAIWVGSEAKPVTMF